jgi:SAM-dependent methyltransferase
MDDKQLKSKQRVTDHGEVFTAKREVNAMLDLVTQETERIDSRFLEPACGTGNFLVEILKRKISVVENRYSKNQLDYERYAIIAISSIYGVDILLDNVQTCRDRLLGIFTHYYIKNYKNDFKPECLKSAEFILSRNILWGDALNLKTPDEKSEPIIFSEWSAVNGSMIKRRDFTLANLLEVDLHQYNEQKYKPHEIPLFSDEGDPAFIPQPIRDFPLIHFLKLGEDDAIKV